MDNVFKRKLHEGLILSTVAEVLIIGLIFTAPNVELKLWRVILSCISTFTGITLGHTVLATKAFQKNKNLQVAIIANPCATFVLAGIAITTKSIPVYSWLPMVCGFGLLAVSSG